MLMMTAETEQRFMGLFNKKQESEDQIVDRLCGNAGNVVAMFQHVFDTPAAFIQGNQRMLERHF